MSFKNIFLYILFFIIGIVSVFIIQCIFKSNFFTNKKTLNQNLNLSIKKELPFDKYKISSLEKTTVPIGNIEILDENNFKFHFYPTLNSKDEKKFTSGRITTPTENGDYPLIIMFRGYVDVNIYQTGIGTKNAADFFSKNGFITIAPDFLGYADSSDEANNIFETRFQTYTTAISLTETILKNGLQVENKNWDKKNIFIWAHSNGGQIALTALVSKKYNIPTTLWAPVTKPFPYNILYYTDESEDRGKLIRAELSEFEKTYNTDDFSFDLFLTNLNAPLQIHQGTADDAVPFEWSREFVNLLKKINYEKFEFFVYNGADHNMKPVWNSVINQDLTFFKKFLNN